MSDDLNPTWCPQCGPHVAVDEDGCCATCGATATGPGADRALDVLGAGPNTSAICYAGVQVGEAHFEIEVNGHKGDVFLSWDWWKAVEAQWMRDLVEFGQMMDPPPFEGVNADVKLAEQGETVKDLEGDYHERLAHLWDRAAHDFKGRLSEGDDIPESYYEAVRFARLRGTHGKDET